MGSQEVLEHAIGMDTLTDLCNGGVTEHSCNLGESENVGELLDDFDSYWEDISDRLTVSRMVSDSVIKGIVCAIEQEAAEKIAQKELELAKLKEMLHPSHICVIDNESSFFSLTCQGTRVRKHDQPFEFPDALHETKCGSLENLKIMAAEQFKKLEKEIEKIKGQVPLRKKSSDPELLRLSGILKDEPKRWIDVDRTLEGLKSMVDSICQEAEDAVLFSKSSLFLWQQEKQFQNEIEGTVMKSCVWGAQHGFENELQAHNGKCLERIKEISHLREDLESVSKSFSSTENEQLLSHGSLEHRKVSSNHVASTTSPLEENDKHEPSIVTMPENLDLAQLKHFSKDELGKYFKGEMMKMKRYFEQIVQEKTEEIFSLKRDYLKERGSSLTVRKGKEFDILRIRIQDVIQKLDEILVESEKWPAFSQNTLSFNHMSDKLSSLISENHQLRELLADKKREVMCLSSQVSDASDKLSKYFMAESKLLRMLRRLKWEKQDVCTEYLMGGDLFKFLVGEAISQLKCYNQNLLLECDAVKKSFLSSEPDPESIIAQGLCEVVFGGAMKDAEEELGKWLSGYQNENEELRLSLKMEVLEKEKTLKLIVAEREKMEQEICTLMGTINERDRLVQEATNALNEERVNLEAATVELHKLRAQTSKQKMKLLKSEENLHIAESKLMEVLEENEVRKGETYQLSKKLDCAMKELLEAAQEKRELLAEIKETSCTLSSYEQRERECRKQLNSMTLVIGKLSGQISDFECTTEKAIRRNCSRMENLGSHLISLGAEVNNLKKMGSAYKLKLEKKGSDLQKAEDEVDLLGDEVDTLLSLLEKIYIALDHYSHILRHYPGIIEILKLVRRELIGEAIKQVRQAR